jgi:hypothetical protein
MRRHGRLVWIGHRENPSIVFDVAVRETGYGLK